MNFIDLSVFYSIILTIVRYTGTSVAYCTAGQTTKNSFIYKNIIHIFILRRRRLCVVGIQSERVRTYLSSEAGNPFCEVVRWPENTHGELTGLLEWSAGLCLQSKITDLILSFQVPCGRMNILFTSRIFLFMAGYRNLHYSVFFPEICWSYLRTEISVILFARQ